MDNSRRVDTLSIKQRISLRTNLVDWGILIPNVGAEFDIRNVNWNRWSASVNVRWRPKTTHTYVKPIQYNIFEIMAEGREYWRERQARPSGYLMPHRHWWGKILSCRNMLPSHPNWIFYRGGWASYSQYSVLFGKNQEGKQGTMMAAGVTWGFVKQFIGFNNGSTVDMEFGIRAGVGVASYDTYRMDEESNCYPKTGHVENKITPVLRDIHVALVYRPGNYPLRKKYRWRYDVDQEFADRKDAEWDYREKRKTDKFFADSAYNVVLADFRQIYDSIADLRHAEHAEMIERMATKRISTVDEKKAEKQHLKDEKARQKALKKEHKAATKQEATEPKKEGGEA